MYVSLIGLHCDLAVGTLGSHGLSIFVGDNTKKTLIYLCIMAKDSNCLVWINYKKVQG
ncbi:hypothetical protein SAMN04488589_2692 [Methanolobus vulcani]|jgi:hypothetical protein|uniref:Uncharacterized protein n=1 Tax=Methanolobus vulcani TaxID=38026 RepID=A0A7Z7AYX3_9EURY|nr:hypothetical protein SAMN04488589_2692 [Methanolobus vulcani]